MYPSLGDFGQPRPPSHNNPMQNDMAGQGPPRWGPPPMPSQSNGPFQPALPSHSSFQHPTLRVHIAEHLRTTPPVMVHRESSEIPRTSLAFNFDYEHQLQQRLARSDQSEAQIVQTDPIDSVRKELSSTDYTWEEISFATTALTGHRLDAEQVKAYCKNFRELRSMGFDLATVTGALLLHKQDLAAATDACLNSQ